MTTDPANGSLMASDPDLLGLPPEGKLAHNITHFARALRRAGLPLGPGRILDAIRAVEAAGFTSRTDFYWTLHACLVTRRADMAVFAQVFRLFWRDPRYLEHMMSLLLPQIQGAQAETKAEAAARRAAEALLDGAADRPPPLRDEGGQELEIDAVGTVSGEERLRSLDFEQMSPDEMAEARAMIARLRLPVDPLPTRRGVRDPLGARPDWRGTLRQAVRRGGEVAGFARRRPGERWPDLVAICDISGSMSQYSRVILHFLHTVAAAKGPNTHGGWARVHAFTFGTRLTNITRHLRTRDVDQALAAAGAEAQDWDGGTRIADCLHQFNRDWGRRVLSRGAIVILITDGLDRSLPGGPDLARETQRLRLSSRRLIWVNPLLRWDGFAPRAAGIAAMLPQVDELRAGHSVASLAALGQALSGPSLRDGGDKARLLATLPGPRR